MKTLIDIKRLEWLITKGEASYSDGRNLFEYELLLELMERLKVRIDKNAAYKRLKNIYKAKQAKRPEGSLDYQARCHHYPWSIQVETQYFGRWGKPNNVYPCKTAKEILDRMQWLRARHIEDAANDNCDYDEIKMSFKFTPSPRKAIP